MGFVAAALRAAASIGFAGTGGHLKAGQSGADVMQMHRNGRGERKCACPVSLGEQTARPKSQLCPGVTRWR